METQKLEILDDQQQSLDASEDLLQSLDQADQIKQMVLKEDLSALKAMGFDPELFPIMQLFAEKGPKIFGSYSHPTELDVHKIKCSVLITELCTLNGITPELIKTIQLDTRSVHSSTKHTLGVGSFGLKPAVDPLALSSTTQDSFQAAESLVLMVHNELMEELQQMRLSKTQSKEVKNQIITLLNSQIRAMQDIMPERTGLNEETLNVRMKEFNIELTKLILEDNPEASLTIRNIGTETLSEDLEHRSLISESLQKLIAIKGIEVVKALGNGEKDTSMLRININGKTGEIALSKEGGFKLILNGNTLYISDEEFIEVIPSALVLGKLEAIILVAGGQTIHVGTDRGASTRALEILGIKDEAKKLVASNLTFGERHIHGHDGIIVGKNFVPLPLQFLILGAEGLRNTIAIDEAIKFEDINEFKKFMARSLINQVINIEA